MSITVNIMSYHYGHVAAQAIESVLWQTLPADVIRFYDDGAGDCEHLPDIYPEVEFILRPTNWGVIPNFNDALFRTTTDKTMFLGADNWLDVETLRVTDASPATIVSYPAWLMKAGGVTRWEPGVPHGSALYNVLKAKEVGGYEAAAHGQNGHLEEDSVMFRKMQRAGATVDLLRDQSPMLMYRWRHRKNFNK